MIHPHGDEPTGDEGDDASEHVERSLGRFHETLNNVEGHKRRLLDAFGWWLIRALLVVGCVGLMLLSRPVETTVLGLLFILTFLFR